MEERRNQPEFEKSPKKWRYNFSHSLFTFWKTAKMYGGENQRINEEISFFQECLNFFFREKDEISILFDGIDIKIDKVRIRGQRADDRYFEDIYDLFLSLCMAGIKFKRGVGEDEILELFRVIGKYPVGREPKTAAFERLTKDLPEQKYIEIYPYDPEEMGNLPIYTVEQSVRRIYSTLAGEYVEYRRMVDAVDNIPLRTIRRSIQDFIMIIQNAKKKELIEFIMFLTSIPAFGGSFKGASAASRVFWSVLVALKIKTDLQTAVRIATAAYFQYFAVNSYQGYAALSRMDDFNYSRIEAAVNSCYRISDFYDAGLLEPDSSSDTLSGEILKIVAYFDFVTKKWPERVKYVGPTLTRPQAIANIIKNNKAGAFKKEIADVFLSIVGIYPPGSVLKIIASGETCVSIGRFKNRFSLADVLVLGENLSVKEKRSLRTEELADIPDAAGIVLPAETTVEILFTFLDEREKERP